MSLKDIQKKYGGAIVSPSFIMEREKVVIPVSPVFDQALGGGIPEGTWVIFSGLPKCGKTTTILQICANAQALGKKIFYFNIEGRLKKRDLLGIHNLKIDSELLHIISSNEDKIYSGEEFLDMATQIIKDKENKGCVLVIDSTSSLCPTNELTTEISPSLRATAPKMLAHFFKQMGQIVPIMDTTAIMIQHLVTNTSGYGAKYNEDGGLWAQYQVDIKIRAHGKETKWLENDKQIGQVVTWDILTSALGTPPSTIESYIRYGYGVDEVMETVGLASDLGVIKIGGSWFTFEDFKIQGKDNLCNHLRNNPDMVAKINSKLKEMLI